MKQSQFEKELRLVFRECLLSCSKNIKDFWRIRVALAESRQAHRRLEELNDGVSEEEYLEASASYWVRDEFSKVLITGRLERLCIKYMIPLPDRESYEELHGGNMYFFNRETLVSIKKNIDLERKKRIEALRINLGLGIGFIGALTGLISVLG